MKCIKKAKIFNVLYVCLKTAIWVVERVAKVVYKANIISL